MKLKKLCEDTLFRGLFCGSVAGALKDLVDSTLIFIDAKEYFWSFTLALIYHEKTNGFFMLSTAILVELIFSSFLGVVFIIIAKKIKSTHYLLMGGLYGSMVWFFVKAAVLAFNIEQLKPPTDVNLFITLILSIFYGIILAVLDRKFSPKTS